MSYDCAHCFIEWKLKYQDIYLQSGYIKIKKDARKNLTTLEATLLSSTFFLNYKTHYITQYYSQVYNTIRPGKIKGDSEVKDIKTLQYNYEKQLIYFMLEFNDPYEELPLIRN